MSQIDSVLEAGGYVGIKAKVSKGETVDAVSARSYSHPGLGERVVVRLTPDTIAEGEDLAMEFLGFESAGVNGPIAKRRRQALGFPGWALINDPDHAGYALKIVKEFKREARRAKSKPGHAYDGFVATAKKLGQSVRHFLPSYWEEVGRTFMELGNSTYASRAFGKARDAEKVHALKVDEGLRRDAFLEFALAGCLSIKALTEYSKELQNSVSAEEAWSTFRELCLRRTLGGMPPWASMTKELGTLIDAAGLEKDAELVRFLSEIVESPAIAKSAEGFWKSASKYVKMLVAENDEAAGILLNLVPETSRYDSDFLWEWVGYLEDWGILENAWNDEAPDAAQADPNTATWFSRLVTKRSYGRSSTPEIAYTVLRKASSRLISDGVPLDLAVKRYWGESELPVDMVDLALELKIPLEMPDEICFDLSSWAEVGDDAIDRPRDPAFLAKDKRFAKALKEAVPGAMGSHPFDEVAIGKASLMKAREEWLKETIADIGTRALPQASGSISTLARRTSQAIFQEFPEAFEQLQAVDLTQALQRTLQGLVFDEFGWEALESAAEKLNPDGKATLRFFGKLPYVIVTNGVHAIVCDPNQIVGEFELQIGKSYALNALEYYDGDLCVFVEQRSGRYEDKFYWASNPKKKLEASYRYNNTHDVSGAIAPLDGGGFYHGGGTVNAGDAAVNDRSGVFFSDGEHFWDVEWGDKGRLLREIDPRTEKKGRKSMPAFLENNLRAGWNLEIDESHLLGLGDFVPDSPLGSKDGLIGFGVYEQEKPHKVMCVGVDGRSYAATQRGDDTFITPMGLIDCPGSDVKLPVNGTAGWRSYSSGQNVFSENTECLLSDLDSELNNYNSGQVYPLPFLFWHALKVRCIATSKQLRKISAKDVKILFDAASEDFDRFVDSDEDTPDLSKTQAAVAKVFKKLKHERLARGIMGIAFEAATLQSELTDLIENRDPEAEDVDDGLSDAMEPAVESAMNAMGIKMGWSASGALFPHLVSVSKFFTAEDDEVPKKVKDGPFVWFPLLNRLESHAWKAFWGATDEQEGWEEFLDAWVELPLQDLPGRFRFYGGSFKGDPPVPAASIKDASWWIHADGGRRYLFTSEGYFYNYDWEVLEYTPKGGFKAPANFDITEDIVEYERTMSAEQISSMAEMLRSGERVVLDDEHVAQLESSTSRSPAEVKLIWCGYPNFDKYEKNFLEKDLRTQLGLKVAEADLARGSLKSLEEEFRMQLLSAIVSGDPGPLEDCTSAVQRLTQAWSAHAPKQLTLDAELVSKLDDIYGYFDVGPMLDAMAMPSEHAFFDIPKKCTIEKNRWRQYIVCGDEETNYFNDRVLECTVNTLYYLNYELPLDAPARPDLATVYDAMQSCLDNDNLLLEVGSARIYNEKKKAFDYLTSLYPKAKKSKEQYTIDDGSICGAADEDSFLLAFRPSKTKSSKGLEALAKVRLAIDAMDEDVMDDTVEFVRMARSAELKAIAKAFRKPIKCKEGAFGQDPRITAPKLVDEIGNHYSFDEDAATLYLQILALPDPTTNNVKEWNEWSTSQYNKAAKTLLKAELVLEAKRSRAGRKYFLPGGWEALKLPHLPLETWKLKLFGAARNQAGQLETPLGRIVPLSDLPAHFKAAWQRILDGDEPQYYEVD